MEHPSYLVPCGCGREFAAEPGEAGAVVACPWCHAAVEVPRLTRLRALPIVAGWVEERHPLQFRLMHLFGLITYIALALTCGKYVGFLATVGMCLFAVLWGLAYAIQPLPTVYATVCGTLLVVIWTLLICSVQQSRESARRTWTTNNLKEIGVGYRQWKKFRPAPANGGAAAEHDEFSAYFESRLKSPPAGN